MNKFRLLEELQRRYSFKEAHSLIQDCDLNGRAEDDIVIIRKFISGNISGYFFTWK